VIILFSIFKLINSCDDDFPEISTRAGSMSLDILREGCENKYAYRVNLSPYSSTGYFLIAFYRELEGNSPFGKFLEDPTLNTC
jgi:hypothetical protein